MFTYVNKQKHININVVYLLTIFITIKSSIKCIYT